MMSTTGRPKNRGVFYSRDSGGEHDQTPAQYVRWAVRRSAEMEVQFTGSSNDITQMIRNGQPVSGDLYFDNSVSGNQMSRPALDALRERVKTDGLVSHIFVPRRDRLARPDNAFDGVQLEGEFRQAGVTIVFHDKVLPPMKVGRRADVGEAIAAYIDYDQSGRFRQELAEKMIYAQLQLAKSGFSIGGRAPFGFRRVLVREGGSEVRELTDGEVVRQAGCHVVWLPGSEDKLDLIQRIFTMVQTMPAARVATILTAEGIPSPDAGRMRTDGGVRHPVSGVWHQTTITNIVRNPLLIAVRTYGQRSMGDQRRFTPEGPRELEGSDQRADGKAKVVRNSDKHLISSAAKFQPLVEPDAYHQMQRELDRRAGTQRGKPRSRNPDQNPLGSRVFDIDCCWPMYRVPRGDKFRYVCGLYQQSHAAECRHNHIDGLLATRFVLAAIQQLVLDPERLTKLEGKLRERAAKKRSDAPNTLRQVQLRLSDIERRKGLATQNMSRAESDEQFVALSAVFNAIVTEEKNAIAELQELERSQVAATPVPISLTMERVRRLADLANDPANLPALTKLFAAVNPQLFLKFETVKKRRRAEQHVCGGVLTLGAAPAPIEKYSGPTGRRAIKASTQKMGAASNDVPSSDLSFTSGEEESSGNVSRGDRI